VSGQPLQVDGDAAERFLALYDAALPYVYGYLLARCSRPVLAEELTSETMLAAVDALKRETQPQSLSTAWLLGIARHKLVDYWRRLGREERSLRSIASQTPEEAEDPWDVHLDGVRARETLEKLAPHHRTVLTLRYLDDLPVADVADILDRTLHATEALLVRARLAFRSAYSEQEDQDADHA
jgi:RNA polymerase sigma-70 factor, ECF subfamily